MRLNLEKEDMWPNNLPKRANRLAPPSSYSLSDPSTHPPSYTEEGGVVFPIYYVMFQLSKTCV